MKSIQLPEPVYIDFSGGLNEEVSVNSGSQTELSDILNLQYFTYLDGNGNQLIGLETRQGTEFIIITSKYILTMCLIVITRYHLS